MTEPNPATLLADLLAQLTLDSVRRLEQHTDIGPGGVTRLLIEINLRQHEHTLGLVLPLISDGLNRQLVADAVAWTKRDESEYALGINQARRVIRRCLATQQSGSNGADESDV